MVFYFIREVKIQKFCIFGRYIEFKFSSKFIFFSELIVLRRAVGYMLMDFLFIFYDFWDRLNRKGQGGFHKFIIYLLSNFDVVLTLNWLCLDLAIVCRQISSVSYCFWDEQKRPKSIKCKNFKMVTYICSFFHWIPKKNSTLECSNRFVVALTVSEIWGDQKGTRTMYNFNFKSYNGLKVKNVKMSKTISQNLDFIEHNTLYK